MTTIKALAAAAPGAPLQPFEYSVGDLRPGQVQLKVEYCGICHSDLSMTDNEWGMTGYPFVPGHEVVGTVEALGEGVRHLRAGQRVGLGWYAGSCQTCPTCLAGDHNLCGSTEQTIVGRHGGFADRVRCDALWAIPLPDALDASKAGPLFCGGITVFNPIVQCGVKPTDRVGVIGIGGLGHLALQFLNKWGCEVTAFSSSDSKREEAMRMGAHHVVSSRDPEALARIAGTLDFIISTVNVPLEWNAYIGALAARGRFHVVGAVLEPIPVGAFSLIMGQKSISGSPLGSPCTTAKMLEFCGRHGIETVTEHFPMSKANDAFEHLKSGKARYRIVLANDLN
ncbi:MAG: NAD(P)-dependent alcohol dehydrogenase [Candidatus Sumerlaeia bacterium]|nr:NAD(P)-dependent alcohol dehydrogenase [Candidatus Sumerlaeia bacterium]